MRYATQYVKVEVTYYKDEMVYGSFYSANDNNVIFNWYEGTEHTEKAEKLLVQLMNISSAKVERYHNPYDKNIHGWTATYFKSFFRPN